MKKLVIAITLCCLVVSSYLIFFNKNSNRNPASIMIDKVQVIKAIQWKINPTESELLIDVNCDDWSSLEVTLKSEGVAYSGEPSRVVQTALCDDGFYQLWPHDLMNNYEGIQKIGIFNELPPEWALEKIKLFGANGALEISAVEIYRVTGEIFIFESH